jgi:hypothetical protein
LFSKIIIYLDSYAKLPTAAGSQLVGRFESTWLKNAPAGRRAINDSFLAEDRVCGTEPTRFSATQRNNHANQ